MDQSQLEELKRGLSKEIEDKLESRFEARLEERVKEEVRKINEKDDKDVTISVDKTSERGESGTKKTRSRSLFQNVVTKILKHDISTKDEEENVSATMHDFAIYALVHHKWFLSLPMVLFSLGVVSLQSSILNQMFVGSFHRRCTLHTDCPLGRYCSSILPTDAPRCFDCGSLNQYDYEHDTDKGLLYKIDTSGKRTETINCKDVWDEVPGWDYGNVDHKYIIFEGDIPYPDEHRDFCLSHLYCFSHNTMDSTCDDYVLNRNRWTIKFFISLLFLAVLGFAPSLTRDMDEARDAEIILNRVLRTHKEDMHFITRVAVEVMYIVIRIRFFVLPFLAAQATAVVLLSDIRVENLMLNILGVVAIVDLDNMATDFFLPRKNIEIVTEFMISMKKGNLIDTKANVSFASWIWLRIIALLAVSLMVAYIHQSPENCGLPIVYAFYMSIFAVTALQALSVFLTNLSFVNFGIFVYRSALTIAYTASILLYFQNIQLGDIAKFGESVVSYSVTIAGVLIVALGILGFFIKSKEDSYPLQV